MNMRTGKTKALAKSAKSILLLLAMLVMGQAEAWAQKVLPYEYGFENNDLASEGWTTSNLNLSSGIGASYKKTGSYGFRFYYNSNPPQYIISPEVNAPAGASNVKVSFYYKTPGSYGPETFQVGYSTTTNSTDAFNGNWDNEVSTSVSEWTLYETTFPVNTKYISIKYNSNNKYYLYIDDITFSCDYSGPALSVYDGTNAITSAYAYDFGIATEGTAKTFILKNPGIESLTVDVSETGSFGATLSSTTIAAGSEVTLTVTMPSTTGSSSVTITPAAESGLDPFVINVNGTVRDPNKVYLDFSGGTIPEGWTSVAIGQYASGYGSPWAASDGYISQSGSSKNYEWAFTSPKLTFAEGETILFETKKYGSSSSEPSIEVQYSTDGSIWTTIGSAFTDDVYGTWTKRSVTIPTADAKYIRFSGWYIHMRNIYGGELPVEPKMVVTQPASLDYGIITTATAKTFTIANTGLATLEGINVTSSNTAFAVTGAPTSLAAGASKEVTITMSAETTGALSSDITVSATGMENVVFTVTGVVLPDGMNTETFDSGLPTNWTNVSWTIADGTATGKSSSAYLTTPKLIFSEGDLLVIKAKRADSDANDYITVQGSSDNGSTWTAYSKKISGSDGLAYPDYGTIVLSDIPTTVNKLRFVGFYVVVDEISGLTYAPVLSVTTGDPATTVTTPAAYDFGECAANATVTYNFANAGAGTINITNVAITGAAAYSTNWTESTACPYDLTITRTYDASRAGAAQAAVVTVTTSEGTFVINVTGTDKAANAPELAVSTNAIDFGKVTANASETVTVTNNGTGSMTVNIASDSEDFTVSAASLTEIGAGESKTFTVTFKYGNPYGVKNGNITVTPTYNAEAAETITVTGKAKDPATWSEDFAGNALPTGWEAGSNWSFADGVAKGAYAYGSTTYLTTPKLEVSAATDELTFDYKATSNYVSVKIQMSKDGGAFADYKTISGLNNGDTGSYTITGLETGTYQFRFANDDYQLDNFDGFKLKAAAAHEAEVKTQTIPTTGNQYVEYTASVDVKVTGTNNEELTVKFFIGDTQYGNNVVKTVTANGTETFEVTFTPDAAVSGDAYFTIESTDIAAFESDKVAVSIAAATVLDEEVAPSLNAETIASLVVKYTAKSGWNTICMPFELTSDILTSIFGAGWKAYEFKSYENGELGFGSTTSFYAGYPYIVYVGTAAIHAEGVKLQNINISRTEAQYDLKGGAYFRGTYAPIAAGGWTKNADTDNIYGVTSEGKIAKAGASATMKGFRAYFDLPAGVTAPSLSVQDQTTGITTIVSEGSQQNGEVYNLNGQKVNTPSKGLYIINGRKVVVK